MNPLFKKLLSPRHMEYLAIDREFKILETSFDVRRFAERPETAVIGQDVRLGFPELIGSENALLDVLARRLANFQLKAISRSLENQPPFYLDLCAIEHPNEETMEDRIVIFFEDVTEIMVLEQSLVQRSNEASLLYNALATSKNYVDKIVGSMTDALIVTNVSGIIQTANQATQHLFGYSETELLNQPISLIIQDELLLLQTRQLNSSQGELFKDIEVTCQTRLGEEVVVAFSCSSVQTNQIDLQNLVYVGRDITARKQAEAQMYRALQRERELNELKSRFVTMTSHEFRTPLSVILLATRLLERFHQQTTEEKRREYLRRIQAAAKHMSQLLEDILTIGQVEAGSLRLNITAFELISFCQEVVADLQTTIDPHRRITFASERLDLNVQMDQKLVRQTLTNLLSNALKYSDSDQAVQLRLLIQADGAVFEVQDQGRGIPPDEQDKVLEPFYRASNVGNISGTGLGLAIVQKSVQVHKGRISVASQVGGGTTVKVILPLSLRASNG